MSQPLFESFPPTDKSEWKQQVGKELKGVAYPELGWKLTEQLTQEPYYTAAELDPARVQEVQGCQKQQPGWLTQVPVLYSTATDTNILIHKSLRAGADAIWLDLRPTHLTSAEFQKVLLNVRLTDTPVVFQTAGEPGAVVEYLRQNAAYQLRGGLALDPLSTWMRTGSTFGAGVSDLREVLSLSGHMPDFRPLRVGSGVFQEAGATVVQELAFTLAKAVEYLHQLTEAGLSAAEVVQGLYFSLPIGTEYLTEIAKLRALRYLYRKVTDAYKVPASAGRAYLHTYNSTFHEAAAAPHTNMLRATSAAMSAAVGGCDALSIYPYDAPLREPGEFSQRIARNISLVLQEEGYLGKVADPAAGAYYLEVLTQQLADAAWALFLEVEKLGGLVPAFEQNFIQEELEKSWRENQEAFQNGKVLVGVTKYRTDEVGEAASRKLEITAPAGEVPYRLLPVYRLSDAWQQG
jgi:methylmalonyl-CoA mutase